jgi:hypothetical protein
MIALIKHEDLIISAILCCCARVIETWVFDESATGRRKGLTPVVDLLGPLRNPELVNSHQHHDLSAGCTFHRQENGTRFQLRLRLIAYQDTFGRLYWMPSRWGRQNLTVAGSLHSR